ncbi:hypothetical protein EV646_10650 [Kribbella antiqua]|uniref:Uncharacterized protein n=1 Tax=Kribbella antiqua TaxID=2512217 RepID=A0A4R2INE6_9ACTN|nr:hypothetical protein EV646_10650 [Kribbella antiqua]
MKSLGEFDQFPVEVAVVDMRVPGTGRPVGLSCVVPAAMVLQRRLVEHQGIYAGDGAVRTPGEVTALARQAAFGDYVFVVCEEADGGGWEGWVSL